MLVELSSVTEIKKNSFFQFDKGHHKLYKYVFFNTDFLAEYILFKATTNCYLWLKFPQPLADKTKSQFK